MSVGAASHWWVWLLLLWRPAAVRWHCHVLVVLEGVQLAALVLLPARQPVERHLLCVPVERHSLCSVRCRKTLGGCRRLWRANGDVLRCDGNTYWRARCW